MKSILLVVRLKPDEKTKLLDLAQDLNNPRSPSELVRLLIHQEYSKAFPGRGRVQEKHYATASRKGRPVK